MSFVEPFNSEDLNFAMPPTTKANVTSFQDLPPPGGFPKVFHYILPLIYLVKSFVQMKCLYRFHYNEVSEIAVLLAGLFGWE